MGQSVDHKSALESLEKASTEGDLPYAHFDLGCLLYRGFESPSFSIPPDPARSLSLWRLAAEKNIPDAFWWLGSSSRLLIS